jgi:hypothetical protein
LEDLQSLQSKLLFYWFVTNVSGSCSTKVAVATLQLDLPLTRTKQGCQLFLGTLYQNEEKIPNLPPNILNVHKMYQMALK